MKSEPYEVLVRDLIKSAKVLDHSKDPCAEDFIPQDQVRYTCIFFRNSHISISLALILCTKYLFNFNITIY